MKPILLEPNDVLFFRDGRPMSGSLSGHGAAWPLPHVVNHAFHAALHRAALVGVHSHRRGRSGRYEDTRDRKFGSLTTAGPFPVCCDGGASIWFFPRPLDAGRTDAPVPTMWPAAASGASNIPAPLKYAVANWQPPTKDEPARWWSEGAWNSYLGTPPRCPESAGIIFTTDGDFADKEHSYGIGISTETGTVEDGAFYSASYLRLKCGWKLGVMATSPDKDYRDDTGNNDLIPALLREEGGRILVGGQQRVCSAVRDDSVEKCLPLPRGRCDGFPETTEGIWLKWVLLTPAIFPQINNHRGGWLPSWVNHDTGDVMLLDGPGANAARRHRLEPGKPIRASLVAALTGKPLPVTGWALPNGSDREQGGAKATHLAVPAGSVYYFRCEDPQAATALAATLNWHGNGDGSAILNRRSTLMGEKGFGLGVCANATISF